jgi:hypothetical protein
MPGPYEGAHAFVFLHDDDERPPAEVIAELREDLDTENGPVFFAALFEGDFAGFAHFAQPDVLDLVDYANSRLFDAGIRSDYATEGRVFIGGGGTPKGPKRKSPRFCAICRVKTNERPSEVLERIASDFDDAEPFVGGSRVIARFQLLIELGADDRPSLDAAIERLGAVPGVLRMRVGTTDTEGTAAPTA